MIGGSFLPSLSRQLVWSLTSTPGSKNFARLIHRRVVVVLHAVNFTAIAGSSVQSSRATYCCPQRTGKWKLNFLHLLHFLQSYPLMLSVITRKMYARIDLIRVGDTVVFFTFCVWNWHVIEKTCHCSCWIPNKTRQLSKYFHKTPPLSTPIVHAQCSYTYDPVWSMDL